MALLKKYLSKIYIPVIWTLVILVLLSLPGSMLPDEHAIKIPHLDKVVHISLFGIFVFLWCFYFNCKKMPLKKLLLIFFYIFILAVIIGTGMEFVQKYFIPNRSFDEGDIIADMIGAGFAYGICNTVLLRFE